MGTCWECFRDCYGGHDSHIHGAFDAPDSLIQDVGVDHGGSDIAVAKQFLDRSDVVSTFQKMCCKGMTQGVAAGGFADSGETDGFFYGSLKHRKPAGPSERQTAARKL